MILSLLRKLGEEIEKRIEAMPITYDVTSDRLFLKGKKEGKTDAQKKAIIKALAQGILTLEQIAEMLDVSLDTVIQVKNTFEK